MRFVSSVDVFVIGEISSRNQLLAPYSIPNHMHQCISSLRIIKSHEKCTHPGKSPLADNGV